MGFLLPAFSWPYAVAEISILLTIGGIMLSVNPGKAEFLVAKICLALAVGIVAARVGASLVSSGEPIAVRLLLTAVVSVAIGVAWVEGWRWISSREELAIESKKPMPPGVPRDQAATIAKPPIVWKWDEGDYYFLGATGGVGERTWIKGFQALGRNTSGHTIGRIGGHIESEITGESLVLRIGGKPIAATIRIPDGAEFDVGVTFPNQYPESQIPPHETGISADKFREQWRSFKFVFEYDGEKSIRRFTPDDIENMLRRFHDATHRDVKPRVSQ